LEETCRKSEEKKWREIAILRSRSVWMNVNVFSVLIMHIYHGLIIFAKPD
jgi:hypothetical protein